MLFLEFFFKISSKIEFFFFRVEILNLNIH